MNKHKKDCIQFTAETPESFCTYLDRGGKCCFFITTLCADLTEEGQIEALPIYAPWLVENIEVKNNIGE
jgi:hypothetical protein